MPLGISCVVPPLPRHERDVFGYLAEEVGAEHPGLDLEYATVGDAVLVGRMDNLVLKTGARMQI